MLIIETSIRPEIGLKTTNSELPAQSDVKQTISVSYASFCSGSFKKLELVREQTEFQESESASLLSNTEWAPEKFLLKSSNHSTTSRIISSRTKTRNQVKTRKN